MKPPILIPRRMQSTRDLKSLQCAMAAAVMRPLTAGSRTQRRWTDGRPTATVVGGFIKPNDRLTALERIEIYNRMYWFRVLDCLYDDCPGLRAVLGVRKFMRLAEAYLAKYPSRSFTLRNLSRRLAQFIREEPQLTSPHTALALDMARFEWAQIEAFDGPMHPPLRPRDVGRANPARLRLRLQPYLSLLALTYAVDDFVIAVKKGALRSDASNAPVGAASAAKQPRELRPRRTRVYLAVHRHDNQIYFKRLEPAAYRLLRALREGETLAHACVLALPKATSSVPVWQQKIRGWFQNWAELGWFCRP
jgi:hypothetical protein